MNDDIGPSFYSGKSSGYVIFEGQGMITVLNKQPGPHAVTAEFNATDQN
jgi:hypothetical protein